MSKKLHIDVETYSSVDIKTSGAYKYMESLDFEILMVAYAFDNEPIEIIDLALGEKLPKRFIKGLQNPKIEKHAHNATFERRAFITYGFKVSIEQWHCTAIKAAYCGLPLSLDQVSKALKLEGKGKSATGKALIRFFCCPIKPTKKNALRDRNFPHHDMEKWEEFKQYCIQDVEAEREIDRILLPYKIPAFERLNYILDQEINDRGVLLDLTLAKEAYSINERFTENVKSKIKEITEVDNPNSPAQLKTWLGSQLNKEIKSLAKEFIDPLIEEAGPGLVADVLNYRKKISRSSIKKYAAMLNCACENGRAHGLFQFYGANRTGRWAGRLIQLQNLKRNYLKDLEEARTIVRSGDYDLMTILYDDISDILSQLIRTALIAKPEDTLAV